jgi:hypothetical protein
MRTGGGPACDSEGDSSTKLRKPGRSTGVKCCLVSDCGNRRLATFDAKAGGQKQTNFSRGPFGRSRLGSRVIWKPHDTKLVSVSRRSTKIAGTFLAAVFPHDKMGLVNPDSLISFLGGS